MSILVWFTANLVSNGDCCHIMKALRARCLGKKLFSNFLNSIWSNLCARVYIFRRKVPSIFLYVFKFTLASFNFSRSSEIRRALFTNDFTQMCSSRHWNKRTWNDYECTETAVQFAYSCITRNMLGKREKMKMGNTEILRKHCIYWEKKKFWRNFSFFL